MFSLVSFQVQLILLSTKIACHISFPAITLRRSSYPRHMAQALPTPLRSSFRRGMMCSLGTRRGLNPVINTQPAVDRHDKTGSIGHQVLLDCIGYGNKRIPPRCRQRFCLHTQSILAFLAVKLPTRIFTSVALYGLYVPAGQAVIVVDASGQ